MKNKRKKIKNNELERIAQELCRNTLRDYVIPDHVKENLTLGFGQEGDPDFRVFELYVAGKRPEDAQSIIVIKVNIYTGEANAEVFLEKKHSSIS
ncbi:hypothetical protein [Lusitaniella coriacea]|uniref:hypothetical protein n=1 Tax=Lusitaniella coriacea TaxID=1983105 RepID=UPI003CE9C804